jgi:DNA-binding NarL/FixJ family response regulator
VTPGGSSALAATRSAKILLSPVRLEARRVQSAVAVFDPLPLFRLGLLAALGEGGTELMSRADLERWSPLEGGVLLLSLPDEEEWVAPDRTGPTVQVIAILHDFTVTRAARALRAGAVNVVPRDAPATEFRRVVEETRAGSLTLTLAVLRAAIATPRVTREALDLSDDELLWLRTLAAGRSVTEIAETAAFSERMMYRKLRELYRRLGVSNRTQALIRARDEGWL